MLVSITDCLLMMAVTDEKSRSVIDKIMLCACAHQVYAGSTEAEIIRHWLCHD